MRTLCPHKEIETIASARLVSNDTILFIYKKKKNYLTLLSHQRYIKSYILTLHFQFSSMNQGCLLCVYVCDNNTLNLPLKIKRKNGKLATQFISYSIMCICTEKHI